MLSLFFVALYKNKNTNIDTKIINLYNQFNKIKKRLFMRKISKATEKNWNKLNVDAEKKKLEHRANKTMSTKKIIPKELFKNSKNIKIIKNYIEYINEHHADADLKKIMRSFCIKWLMENELIDDSFEAKQKNVLDFLNENNDIYLDILKLKLPLDEEDILGILYQCFQNEGDKNRQGSYYTPEKIVQNMVSQMNINAQTKILDPCCGTGTFLCKSNIEKPNNLWGVDIDKISIMIAKVNLIIKYKGVEFTPNLFAFDFLENTENSISNEKFDYIITNPPWGADVSYISNVFFREIRSEESFSYMIVNSKKYLKKTGELLFLLPESFLNVKIHSDIREFLLRMMKIDSITLYPSSFSGVLTKFISIKVKNENLDGYEFYIEDLGTGEKYFNSSKEVLNTTNFVISKLSDVDKEILNKIFDSQYNTLDESIWALGIVTGDNNGKLKKAEGEKLEPIYTGKEISEYRLMPVKNYIEYNREAFQQAAPDRIYRADEKLVYKFISKDLVFAYDNNKSLVLNSANILIPNIEGMSIKTSMAFLNSNIFKYIYRKLFGEIKILKGNLEKLPFPVITSEENIELEHLCDEVLLGDDEKKVEINEKIYTIFELTKKEAEYVEKALKI